MYHPTKMGLEVVDEFDVSIGQLQHALSLVQSAEKATLPGEAIYLRVSPTRVWRITTDKTRDEVLGHTMGPYSSIDSNSKDREN